MPIGECKNQEERNNSENVFTLCGLDNCLFSSGMLSVNTPSMTYGNINCHLHPLLPFISYDQYIIKETLMRNLKKRNEEPVAIHANWITGNHEKMARLQQHGLWLARIATDGNYTCAASVAHNNGR